jgi:hypothetical protein
MVPEPTPVVFRWTAAAQTTYLAMMRPQSGEGSYEVAFTESSPVGGQYGWTVLQDDDGEVDARGGEVLGADWSLYKELILPEDPGDIAEAVLQYLVVCEPYDTISGLHPNWPQHPPESKQWPDLEAYVNDALVLKAPLDEVAMRGWYNIRIDPSVLRRGPNVIRLTQEAGGNDSFYIALDLDNDHDRSYLEYKGEILEDELGPGRRTAVEVGGHGEYLVRLKYMLQ